MQKKKNRDFLARSSGAKSSSPYLHRVFSKNNAQKNINLSCKQSAETLHRILTQVNFDVDTVDEALIAIGSEYYRLASLVELDEYSSQRMLLILSLAEIDITLSHLINYVDAFLASEKFRTANI